MVQVREKVMMLKRKMIKSTIHMTCTSQSWWVWLFYLKL